MCYVKWEIHFSAICFLWSKRRDPFFMQEKISGGGCRAVGSSGRRGSGDYKRIAGT